MMPDKTNSEMLARTAAIRQRLEAIKDEIYILRLAEHQLHEELRAINDKLSGKLP